MKRGFLFIILALTGALSVSAFGWNLDSIAAKGKFARFCIDTYRWGDKFFNGYDTTYVSGTGYKFNIKLRTESWTDYYELHFDNKTEMSMISNPSTSVGFYLNYMAVTVGYDMNLSKYFNGHEEARRRWNFGFSCMLFSANLYFIQNDVGTHISTLKPFDGKLTHPDLEYKGIDNTNWGLDLMYYFKHKKYSHPAAFTFSRIQQRSAGSAFAGFSFNRLKYKFDFNGLPDDISSTLPTDIPDNRYVVDTKNYLLSGGYGYNWVFAKHWLMGAAGTIMYGLSSGYYKELTNRKTTFTAMGIGELSVVWNNNHWFAGIVGYGRFALVRDHKRSMLSSIINMQVSVGYRFNLW